MDEIYGLSQSGKLMQRLLDAPVDVSFRDEVEALLYEYTRRKGYGRPILLEEDFFPVASMIMDFKSKYDVAMDNKTPISKDSTHE